MDDVQRGESTPDLRVLVKQRLRALLADRQAGPEVVDQLLADRQADLELEDVRWRRPPEQS